MVATPIGNPKDITIRACEILATADLVLCEDTRITGQLLSYHGIKGNLQSYHEHNMESRHPQILERLTSGESIALVSDAGTPLISDPGCRLVKLTLESGAKISVIPGASAALAGLSASGLDTTRFAFEGFLPAKGKERRERIAELVSEKRTIILYEAPHRLKRTLADLNDEKCLQKRRLSIGRELTKEYEEYLYLTLQEALDYYEETTPRGEFVLILEGKSEFDIRSPQDVFTKSEQASLDELITGRLAQGKRLRQIAKEIAELTGLPANDIYERTLQLKGIKTGPPQLDGDDKTN